MRPFAARDAPVGSPARAVATTLPIPVSASRQPQVLVDVEHLAAADGRLVALGSLSALDTSVTVAWESADGQTWTETAAPPVRVTDVTSGPGGLVVTGHDYGEPTSEVWRSTDGAPQQPTAHRWT